MLSERMPMKSPGEVLRDSVIASKILYEDYVMLENASFRKQYYKSAIANRILLHSMDLLVNSNINLSVDEYKLYKYLEKRYVDSIMTLENVVSAFDKNKIKYAIIKSLRDYRATTVDIDVLVIGGRKNLPRAYKALINNGFVPYAAGPESATLAHPQYNVSVDLYVEVGASRLIYCPRDIIEKFLITRKFYAISQEIVAITLDPAIEFLLISGHSLIKEQMFTLADFLMLRERLLYTNIDKIKNYAIKIRCKYAYKYALQMLYKLLRGEIPPIKIRPIEIALQLGYLASEAQYFRKSIIWQILYLLNLNKAAEFSSYIFEHLTRETY